MLCNNLLFIMLVLVLAVAALGGAENLASNDSGCILNEIETRLGIAAEIIETARQKFPTDLNELCKKNFNNTKCKNEKPMDCSDVYLNGERTDGLYDIWPQSRVSCGPLRVYCDMESNGGGWTVIQRRGDYKSPEDYFYKDWNAYKIGFGDRLKDFWIGNDNLFALTNQRPYQLRVNLTAWDGDSSYAIYDEFWTSDENQNYTLHVNGYRGKAGDSLKRQNGQQFSTKDRDNDLSNTTSCAEKYKAGWWYEKCVDSNLNGLYLRGNASVHGEGVMWQSFKGYQHSLKDTSMKIRPTGFTDMRNRIN